MKLFKSINLLIGTIIVSSAVFLSCKALNEDLPECRLFVKFKYDYNMEYVDSFHKWVDEVELYVFDKDGKFLFSKSENGEALSTGNYLMEVDLPTGQYKFMAWAWTDNASSYRIEEFTPGMSIEEMKLKLNRSQERIVNNRIERIWYGEIIDVDFTGQTNQVETINLIHDINNINFIFQSVSQFGWGINLEDYRFEIVEANGYLGYDNSLLSDDMLSYRPYSAQQISPQAIKVELSMLRLMQGRDTRFIVTDIKSNVVVFNISLQQYFEYTLSDYKNMGVQEYFDRQWEWNIVFYLSDSWIATQININEWTWYRQTEVN